MSWWKHAFAVESDKDLQVNDAQSAIVDKLADAVVRRGMTTPALMFLEMSRPLNYLGSQVLHFFSPLLSMFDTQSHRELALFLEQRGSIDYICRRIEAFEHMASKARNATGEQSASDAHHLSKAPPTNCLTKDDAADPMPREHENDRP